MNPAYPFSAIVGQQAMKTALLLNAVDPSIGGVLIRGEKGTAKSTAVRALSGLLPTIEVVENCPYHCPADQPERMHTGCRERFSAGETLPTLSLPMPLVELPLGATEDRLAGTIHLQETLTKGDRQFQPGLLATANRGILYVDEVNLLEDHLVDLLLDAAASGINRVEREGLRIVHPARFNLIGTMNPEEGELRPQFLDRFGLTVNVKGLSDASARARLARDHLAFEQDPQGFAERWQDEEQLLSRRIMAAKQALVRVEVEESAVDRAIRLALELKVQGHRADIVLLKAARAFAALLGKNCVDQTDIHQVAWFVLPHRLPDAQLLDSDRADALLAEALCGERSPLGIDTAAVTEPILDEQEFPGAAAAGSMLFDTFKKKLRNG